MNVNAGYFEIEAYADGWPISVYIKYRHHNSNRDSDIRIEAEELTDLEYCITKIRDLLKSELSEKDRLKI